MLNAAIGTARRWLSLGWLTGPIFHKELCVSSRRRRNYVLRSVYVASLGLVIVLIWLEQMRYGSGTMVFQVSRMAMVGKTTIMFTVWFQFIVTQIIAVVTLSGSISDEVYHRTLSALATTPITGLQIVVGKLLSRLLQLVLLLAISLPLLAVVRVFGGVPWPYVVWSLAITVSTAIFVGSLAMFISIFTRRTYVAIITTVLILAGLFALLPLLTAMILLPDIIRPPLFTSLMTACNPYVALAMKTQWMMYPRGMGMMLPSVFAAVNCGVMLLGSGILVTLSAILVRRLALRLAAGQMGKAVEDTPETKPGSTEIIGTGGIRRVWSSAMLWKEFRSPLLGRHKVLKIVGLMIGVFVVLTVYLLCANENMLQYGEVQATFAVVFTSIGTLIAIVIPATMISSEKESDAWPLLLTTTLSDGSIILGKLAGALRRCAPVWVLLFAHVAIFVVGGVTHPIAMVHLVILVSWYVFFLCCSGLYFSSRFKRTTVAVSLNFAFAAVIWAAMPILLFILTEITRGDDSLAELYADSNPFVQLVIIVQAATHYMRTSSGWDYWWASGSSHSPAATTAFLILCNVLYTWVALMFLWRAKAQLRRRAV